MWSLRKILEAIGRTYSRSGTYPFGPWMSTFPPPRHPYRGEGR